MVDADCLRVAQEGLLVLGWLTLLAPETLPAFVLQSVWKAPATANLTAMRALNSGLAISTTLSTAAIEPEQA